MDHTQLNGIANCIWGIADDVLRDVYVRGKYAPPTHPRSSRKGPVAQAW
jgi:type I restriction enzyme M protein